mmetsp:Transcript_9310/g.20363  ORF Transcript_9310/g.20363 Transcript_9310/m.20363 type:complete len:142 (+) Transcript_9310:306-731(+)
MRNTRFLFRSAVSGRKLRFIVFQKLISKFFTKVKTSPVNRKGPSKVQTPATAAQTTKKKAHEAFIMLMAISSYFLINPTHISKVIDPADIPQAACPLYPPSWAIGPIHAKINTAEHANKSTRSCRPFSICVNCAESICSAQ